MAPGSAFTGDFPGLGFSRAAAGCIRPALRYLIGYTAEPQGWERCDEAGWAQRGGSKDLPRLGETLLGLANDRGALLNFSPSVFLFLLSPGRLQ